MDHGRWATSDAKNTGRDQIAPNFLKPKMRNTGRDQLFPKLLLCEQLSAPALSIDARVVWETRSLPMFRISGFGIGEVEPGNMFGNLRCENIGGDQISPKFLVPALPIDASNLEILGKADPCQCFRISGF